jgi:putative colanic acid biosynthesis acetyltransferase WcaF
VFGCKIDGKPFVHQRARIQIPWRIVLHDRACVGDRANLYSLGEIELGRRCVIAQEAYLCTGTHDLTDPNQPLVTGKITVGTDAFVGARAFLMPGISIGEGAVVGACSVVTRDVGPRSIVAGSPARFLRLRK